MSNVIVTAGNSMMGDDGAGPLLADLLGAKPAKGWNVIDGNAAPEKLAREIQAWSPQRLIIVHATDMGLAPGELRLIDEASIAKHYLPLNLLMQELRGTIGEVLFIGIQPGLVAFSYPMTEKVRNTVEKLHESLLFGDDPATYPQL